MPILLWQVADASSLMLLQPPVFPSYFGGFGLEVLFCTPEHVRVTPRDQVSKSSAASALRSMFRCAATSPRIPASVPMRRLA